MQAVHFRAVPNNTGLLEGRIKIYIQTTASRRDDHGTLLWLHQSGTVIAHFRSQLGQRVSLFAVCATTCPAASCVECAGYVTELPTAKSPFRRNGLEIYCEVGHGAKPRSSNRQKNKCPIGPARGIRV